MLFHLHEWLIFDDFCGFHVGEYTSPMDPMGFNFFFRTGRAQLPVYLLFRGPHHRVTKTESTVGNYCH